MPDPFPPLDPRLPAVLLPVRLETRVERGGDGSAQDALLLRIYPDTLHVDGHDPRLTDRELRHGRDFWTRTWRAGGDAAAARRAWRALADAFGDPRAAWVAEALRPRNPEDRPEEPLGPGEELPVEPDLPSPTTRGDEDLRPSESTTLPGRWLVLGGAGGSRLFAHWSREVPDRLQVGPDPSADGGEPGEGDEGGGTPAVDAGMRWMVDFDAAVEVGMAARIPLRREQLEALDTVVVVGVKGSLDGEAAARRLEGLLAAHHYTEGLELLPAGFPTNNTDQTASGYHSGDADHERSFLLERGGDGLAPGDGTDGTDGTDGARVAAALGVGAEVLAHVGHAGARGDEAARAMSTALWPTTWGYFLGQIVRTVAPEEVAAARALFVEQVRGRGPYPTLRAGRQPYGLLPVLSLDRWQPPRHDTADVPVVALLRRLREVWRRSADRVAHVPTAAAPDRALLEVLSMQPVSVRYWVRHLLGPAYVGHLDAFLGLHLEQEWWDRQQELAGGPLRDLPGGRVPWLRSAVWAPRRQPVTLPLVHEEEAEDGLSPEEPPAPNHARWVREHGYVDVRESGPEQQSTLLARLLRHASLLEYALAAHRLLVAHGSREGEVFEHELVNVEGSTVTVWHDLERVEPGISGDRTLGAFLDGLEDHDDPAVSELGEFRRALGLLARTPAAELGRLLPETLDCASHRLDAWVTGLATKRLDELRSSGARGIVLGGYGWVHGGGLTRAGEGAPAGYVHAPSLTQAATAAVLRGGRDSHREEEDALCLDLSSRRARQARWLLDGVAQGQPLGALLGYRLERGLHEGHPGLELDRFIAPLRALAPMAGDGAAPGEGTQESVAARDVVDGLRLHRRAAREGLPYGTRGLPAVGSPEHAAIEEELAAVDALVDALGDATLAEAVHELVQGNTERVRATVAGLAHGDVAPPDLDVLRTARTGGSLTHRVLLLLQESRDAGEPWPSGPRYVRASVEPRLDAWAARVVGDPRQVRARVRRGGAQDGPGEEAPLREVSLHELDLAPLDVLHAGAAGEGPEAELAARVRLLVAREDGGGSGGSGGGLADVEVLGGRDPGWGPEVLSFDEVCELARCARDVVGAGRALDGRDVAMPGSGASPGVDTDDLTARADAAVEALQDVTTRLSDAAGAAEDAHGGEALPVDVRDELLDALLDASRFGLVGAVPGDPRQTGALLAQARRVLEELANRAQAATDLAASFERAAASPGALREHDEQRVRVVLGEGFRVLALVLPDNRDELLGALAEAAPPGSGDPLAAQAWLHGLAPVRPRVRELADLLDYAEALDRGLPAGLRVGQLPLRDGDRWVGLPSAPGTAMPAGRLSLVVHAPGGRLDEGQPLAGLHVDDWQELVPHGVETTGVAFGYDQPDSRAPQAVLLAVPPGPPPAGGSDGDSGGGDDSSDGWDAEALVDTVLDALELARLRGVDPDTLGELGHYLPAVCLASNVRESTVSTRFERF